MASKWEYCHMTETEEHVSQGFMKGGTYYKYAVVSYANGQERIHTGTRNALSDDPRDESFLATLRALNMLGQQGWEVVKKTTRLPGSSNPTTPSYMLRRPIP